MRRFLGALFTAAALTAAGPALAHEHDDEAGYARYYGGYQNLDALYQHDMAGIRHGLSDGSYSRGEARYFWRELRSIRQRESYYRWRDGWLSPEEGQEIQARLERLHEVMHDAHEEGHARQDDWNDDRDGGYYNGRYPQDRGYGG